MESIGKYIDEYDVFAMLEASAAASITALSREGTTLMLKYEIPKIDIIPLSRLRVSSKKFKHVNDRYIIEKMHALYTVKAVLRRAFRT